MNRDSKASAALDQPQWPRFVSRLALLLATVIAVGVILRLTLQDRIALTAPLFYALPLPVLSTLALLRVSCALLLRQRRAALLWVAVCLALCAWTGATMIRRHEPLESADSLRIVCWNVARGDGGWNAAIAETIRRQHPDVIGLVEAGGMPEDRRDFFAHEFPDFQTVELGRGLVCLSRHEAGQGRRIILASGGYAGELTIHDGDRDVTMILVDLKSDPFRSRAAPLRDLAHHAAGLVDRPVVIMGDFNTPVDSVHLEPLRAGHRETFDIVGRGYAATWPIPLPVLQLDQIWTNSRVRPLACIHAWPWRSDHRPVVADVAILPSE